MNFFYKLFSIILTFYIFSGIDLHSQIKLAESFEGTVFPPAGWSTFNSSSSEGQWDRSNRKTNVGTGCAVSNFSLTLSSNYLITKRFTPSAGDSLVFYFRQNFWNVYKDTFKVRISNIDSTVATMNTVLLNICDGLTYPSYLNYGRFAISLNSFAGQRVWVAFQHIDVDGDNIRIDEINVGTPVLSEVGVTQNVFPSGQWGICSLQNFIPKATIRNFGSVNVSTPFSITYTISGPVNYTSTRSDTISAGIAKTIYFDSLNNINIPGLYNVKIYTSLPGDINNDNDTLFSTFILSPSNYGGGGIQNGNYFFANSSQCSSGALSHPEFCWRDTTSSRDLILNGDIISSSLLTGDGENGYFSLGNILPGGKKIRFFNTEYDSIFISTNGIIGFTKHDVLLSNDPANIIDLMSVNVPAVAPLWLNIDFENASVNKNRLSYKVSPNQLIITYDNAPLKSGNSEDYISFQIVFEIGNSLQYNSNIVVQFNEENTGSSFLGKYFSNTLPAHLIGMKNASGSNTLSYRYSDSSNVLSAGTMFNSSLAVQFGTQEDKLNSGYFNANLKILLENIYPRQDTVTVSIAAADNPGEVIESAKIYLLPDGSGTAKYTLADNVNRYYLIIEHRNSIKTWSRLNGEMFTSNSMNFDFSLNQSMAYGNNQKLINSEAFIFSGDTDQDGTVDAADLSNVDNFSEITFIGYNSTDINGDGITDGGDISLVENSVMFNINSVSP
ncbi:MAG TPA: choice-of-anchor J domain-containing protein [Ignavibacteria bacterium]|nr:choice-of-anchor J domain-containing protein [Ignavibacteria bacterium]